MSSSKKKERKEKREREKAQEQKKTEMAPGVQEAPKVLSKIDIERQKNLSRAETIRTRRNDMVREVLLRTNGEFTGEQRKLFDLYLFEDRSPEDTMRELNLPSDEFYRLVEQTMKEMRKHIRDFNFS
ncbi:MAG: hypothetical protein AB1333_02875 [Patescibacteria group bacterium]